MTNIAYLRVSTDAQDTANQKHGILEYCNDKNISGVSFIEDTASGKKEWRKRKLGEIVENLQKGDSAQLRSATSLAPT
uniref:Resolvase, N terminal domain n=1 Tax=Candidatus Kentrum sp. FM TaxID=2126340 RepID=A0A450TMF9_9GAMM|nr:MAG: Resolvase, N terminal domain [Candidatus Kentron sp. FM]VFJ69531.1 MAG: Resolvase, N terminal domain [Candidatus Kentron sp. FM]VFK19503.1 MAG: Resolvase, N terminal domain [Candidatus Kentron sp. FM]